MNLRVAILIGGMFLGLTTNVDAKPAKQVQSVAKAVKDKKEENKPTVEYKDFTFTYDKEDYKTLNAPVFSTTKKVVFQSVSMPKKDDRFKNVMNAVSKHEKEKPAGWEDLVADVAAEPDDLVKLKMANSIINKVPYKDGTDGTYYHPAKLFSKGGVCKDMAISKYLLLRDAGYNTDNLRIAVLTPRIDKPESPFHVVLVAKANDQDYVLDLIPSYLAEQERAKLKTTKEKQIKAIREAGLDLDNVSEKELMNPKGFYSLGRYVSERGLVWAGNEFGTRVQFVEPKPVAKKPGKKVQIAKK